MKEVIELMRDCLHNHLYSEIESQHKCSLSFCTSEHTHFSILHKHAHTFAITFSSFFCTSVRTHLLSLFFSLFFISIRTRLLSFHAPTIWECPTTIWITSLWTMLVWFSFTGYVENLCWSKRCIYNHKCLNYVGLIPYTGYIRSFLAWPHLVQEWLFCHVVYVNCSIPTQAPSSRGSVNTPFLYLFNVHDISLTSYFNVT